jgi:hypothetical protein
VAGGLFTDRYTSLDAQVEPGSRFDTSGAQGQVRATFTKLVQTLSLIHPEFPQEVGEQSQLEVNIVT